MCKPIIDNKEGSSKVPKIRYATITNKVGVKRYATSLMLYVSYIDKMVEQEKCRFKRKGKMSKSKSK